MELQIDGWYGGKRFQPDGLEAHLHCPVNPVPGILQVLRCMQHPAPIASRLWPWKLGSFTKNGYPAEALPLNCSRGGSRWAYGFCTLILSTFSFFTAMVDVHALKSVLSAFIHHSGVFPCEMKASPTAVPGKSGSTKGSYRAGTSAIDAKAFQDMDQCPVRTPCLADMILFSSKDSALVKSIQMDSIASVENLQVNGNIRT